MTPNTDGPNNNQPPSFTSMKEDGLTISNNLLDFMQQGQSAAGGRDTSETLAGVFYAIRALERRIVAIEQLTPPGEPV